MKLDPSIKSLSDVLTPFDTERAEQFIGQKGYFGIRLVYFSDIKKYCIYGTLAHVLTHPEQVDPFLKMEGDDQYQFFLPESSLKPIEKKYRPYTFQGFWGDFTVGRPVKFRKKGEEGDELYFILNGYSRRQFHDVTVQYINLGGVLFTLKELFDGYEWYEDATGGWVPFGVEVEE